MKLKLTADPKKWMIFILYCIVALYIVAVLVLNLSYFANYGAFWGFNPIMAFTPDYLLATIFGFVAVIVASFLGVSSYFFERDKGVGFSTTPKKEKGYSRWETEREFQKQLSPVLPGSETIDKAGIPLINNGKTIWVDSGEYHNLIIGSTGSGKTEIIVQPMVKILAKKGESMIITDPKGEIYERNAVELREKGYNVVLLNFRNPQNGNSWNPLNLPYQLYKSGNKDKATELLDDLAINILYDQNAQNQDPFWEKTSADYFTGLSLGLFEDAKEEEININSINLMTTVGEDKVGPSTYIKEYFNLKGPESIAYMNASSTINAPNDTKQSILSVFKQKIKLFSSKENLSEMLSKSDFEMEDIGRKKTAVFLVIHDEKKTYHSLATIFLKQCYETLIDVAQENGGKLPYKTNFILDEFANMPPLKDVTTMVTAARSRQIRFTFIIQNFAQLSQVYGKEDGDTIKGNCGNIIYLISSELAALEEISKMCGEVKSKEKDKTASTPLVTVSDLQRLPMGTIIILRTRTMPFKTKMMYNWQMERDHLWGRSYPKSDYPQREKGIVHLFDLKKFIDAKRDEKINNMLAGMAGRNQGAPAGSGSGGAKPNMDINDFFKKIDQKLAEQNKPKPTLAPDKPKEEKIEIPKETNKEVKDEKVPGSLTAEEKDSIKATVREAMKKESSKIEEIKKKQEETKKAEEETKTKEAELKEQEIENKRIEEELKRKQALADARMAEEEKKNEELKRLKEETERKLAKEKEERERLIRLEEEKKKKLDEEKARISKLEEARAIEQAKIDAENKRIEELRLENEAREAELKAFEERRKAQEEELQKAIQNNDSPETKDTYEVSEEAKHQITEDEFFDDFFNDDYY
ncbi:MAG: type IV secretory system conjugative DNA transfer family protein [Bacilli bacterium]|nr:type IV secretory system conjugative DNA transfer family protein [Bacilli bacterium]